VTQAWDFVNAEVLWQRAEAMPIDEPVDTEFLAKRVDEIDWGLRVGKRIKDVCERYCDLEQVNGQWDYVRRPIVTVADLRQKTGPELLRMGNFGHKALAGVKKVLREHGLELA